MLSLSVHKESRTTLRAHCVQGSQLAHSPSDFGCLLQYVPDRLEEHGSPYQVPERGRFQDESCAFHEDPLVDLQTHQQDKIPGAP